MANKLENINRDLNNHKSTSTTNIECLEITEFNEDRANQEKTNLAKLIRDTEDIDFFLSHIVKNDINIFLPNEQFFTVFHSLLQAWRWSDFKRVSNFILDYYIDIKKEKDIVIQFKSIMANDQDELDPKQITNLFSNLKDLLIDGILEEENDKEIIQDIDSVSIRLEQIADSVFANLTEDEIFPK